MVDEGLEKTGPRVSTRPEQSDPKDMENGDAQSLPEEEHPACSPIVPCVVDVRTKLGLAAAGPGKTHLDEAFVYLLRRRLQPSA